jgi:hypothetical protein
MLTEFIYENNNSISKLLCKEIIELYEDPKIKKNNGVTIGGLNKEIKDTTDYIIPKSSSDEKWNKLEQFLYKELNKNLLEYLKKINKNSYKSENNSNHDSTLFNNETLEVRSFMIQKYEKNVGKYVYHNDFAIEKDTYKHRVITFLWYLNTVEEGGETEFWDNYKIKPKVGKLILFPASWCFPHRGKVPISDNKYIITGWFYINTHPI